VGIEIVDAKRILAEGKLLKVVLDNIDSEVLKTAA